MGARRPDGHNRPGRADDHHRQPARKRSSDVHLSIKARWELKKLPRAAIMPQSKGINPMQRSEIVQKVKTFVVTELLKNPEYDLGEDEALFSSGAIDSFAMAQVGVFIEAEFDLYIPDPELTVENMDTVRQITDRIIQGLSEA
jgi:acyl carrier protein